MVQWLIGLAVVLALGCAGRDANGEARDAGEPEPDGSSPDGSSGHFESNDPRLDGLRGPEPARERCSSEFPSESDAARGAARLAKRGDYVFALSPSGLTSIDLAAEAGPRVVDRDVSILAPIEVVLLSDDVALVISESDCSQRVTLTTFDVSDPADLRRLSRDDVEGKYAGLQRAGEVIYVITLDESIPVSLQVTAFDISDPRALVQGASLALTNEHDDQGFPVLVTTSERLYSATVAADGSSTLVEVVALGASDALSVTSTFTVPGGIYWSWQLMQQAGVVFAMTAVETVAKLSTFAIDADHRVAPLGALDMLLEVKQLLLDGTRAYIEYQQDFSGADDGWRAIDLRDPAEPKLEARLEIPRGSRLFARGDRLLVVSESYEDVGQHAVAGEHSVALLDVSSLAAPVPLDEVVFEGLLNWPSTFDLQGDLLAIPTVTFGSECGHAGVQLIAIGEDVIDVLGSASLSAGPERLRVLDDHLLSVSFDGIELFDIDGAALTPSAELALARAVARSARVGDHLAVVGTSHGSDAVFLDVHAIDEAPSSLPIGSLDWGALEACGEWGRHVVDLRVDGTRVHVLYRRGGDRRVDRVATIDVSEPTRPRLAGEQVLSESQVDDFDARDYGVQTSQPIEHGFVQLDALVPPPGTDEIPPRATLHVVRAPASGPAAVGEVALEDAAEQPVLAAHGDRIYVGRMHAQDGKRGVDFEVDAIDIDDAAAPVVTGTYSVPGRLLSAIDGERLLTVGFERSEFDQDDDEACFERGGYVDEDDEARCVVLEETLHLVRFERDRFVLEDSYALPEGLHVLEASVAGRQVFVRASRWRKESPAAGEIIVLFGANTGGLEAAHVEVDNVSGRNATLGERFALVDREGTAFIFEASDMDDIDVQEQPGVCSSYASVCEPAESGFVARGYAGLAALE